MRLQKRYFPYYILVMAIMLVAMGIFSSLEKNKYKEELCWSSIRSKITTTADLDSLLNNEIRDFQQLVERSLIVRSEMIRIGDEIKKQSEGPVSSKHLDFLKENTELCLVLRDELYEVTHRYECALDATSLELEEYGVAESLRTKAVTLSLAAALTLYDNYLVGALLFENDKRLRRILNDPDKGFSVSANELLNITLAANSINKQKRVQNGIHFFEKNESNFINKPDNNFDYLRLLIKSSPSYNYMKNVGTAEMVKRKFKMFGRISQDVLAEIRDDGFDGISKFFGNSVGLVESRKGKLFNRSDIHEELLNELKPLDILLEKTPFRLTDKLIPGHFGHVAIWLGNESELKEKGIWNNEVVIPHHSKITPQGHIPSSDEGAQIVEALRGGVKLSSLKEFMNIDDIAILRPVFTEKKTEKEKESLLLAFRQVGKEYDFNFDVNTTEKIVCSELAYVCFPQIDWPTEKTAGRYTISPDNVANLCWNGFPLKLVSFYHDGSKCKQDDQLSLLKRLMSEEKSP